MARVVTYTPSKKVRPKKAAHKPIEKKVVLAPDPKKRRYAKRSAEEAETSPEIEDFFKRNIRPPKIRDEQ
ncbi:MAG: hypothetical protein ACJ8AW_12010 [Rhodopila sp.]